MVVTQRVAHPGAHPTWTPAAPALYAASMLAKLHLKNVGPAPEMLFEPTPRVNLITGDNGLGKSFLLDVAWWALTQTWPAEVNKVLTHGYPATPKPGAKATIQAEFESTTNRKHPLESTFDHGQQEWTRKQGRPPIPGLVIYAMADGGFAVWDPQRNYFKKTPSGIAPPPAYVFTPRDVVMGIRNEDREDEYICNGLLRDWSYWQARNDDAFKMLTRALPALSPQTSGELSVGDVTTLSALGTREVPTIRMGNGPDVPFVHLSSGIRRILSLTYLLVWTWHAHLGEAEKKKRKPAHSIVFLIDEMETHLHPSWQQTVLAGLLKVVGVLDERMKAGVQLIATTHSPLVLASLEPTFDAAKDAWWALDLVQGARAGAPKAQLSKREWERHGDAAQWLESDAFHLSGGGYSVEAREAMEWAASVVGTGKPTRKLFNQVDQRLKESLSEKDPFWQRWRFMKQHLESQK